MLSAVMALAITSLLAALRPDNGQDYVLAAFFLICTTSFLKIRWFVGTAFQVPTWRLPSHSATTQGLIPGCRTSQIRIFSQTECPPNQ